MQSPNNVTTIAFDGLVKEVAIDMGITNKALYQQLGKHNPYSRLWKILTPLGRLDIDRLLIVQADFNARVARIAKKEIKPCISSTHREVSEAMQSIIDKTPKEHRKCQILEAIAELQKQLAACE